MKPGPKPRPVAERLWPKVDRSGGPEACWPWLGATNGNGYGKVAADPGQSDYAHRVAYRLAIGEIPASLDVLHSCDNPPCCNPAHLFAGTAVDNGRDMVAKGRHGPRRVLTPALVATIRALSETGLKPTAIGRRLGVGRYVVSDVVNGRSWQFI